MLRTLSIDFTMLHTNCPDMHDQANIPEFEMVSTVISSRVHEGVRAKCPLCGAEVRIEFGVVSDGPTPV